MSKPNEPSQFDVVLGGNSPSPAGGVVLGGIEGIKNRLASPHVEIRIAALQEALKYHERKLKVVVKALQDESIEVQQYAYKYLQHRSEPFVKEALKNYPSLRS
jgi:hypothetical protein